MNAAICRFQRLDQREKCNAAVSKLEELHKIMLQSSVSAIKDACFARFSQSIKQNFDELRATEDHKLLAICKIREANDNSIELTRAEIVSRIKESSSKNSVHYRDLMVQVIERTLEVMGDAPCDFVIDGLGSLAREEITLSSDFEHVIILDDDTPHTENIREYFLWFTVIFHVIIIGLRETIIPSVDITGLCDHYRLTKRTNGFKIATRRVGCRLME